ncbi:hypothetical protein KFL_000020760 [Klebsormidium nitens]|uniref:Uncharacterized protein n=1 Tax=Klebsormidium nitens TaxID=105231 RepID=A0A1Y1HH01_KLENI|nr:hypothetical protein KFL_000020760 [Klebsormidium nitens]|eukprot:GAQ77715.1 hypothetical protein KFL_000020760 [Klebsormidium nitens]
MAAAGSIRPGRFAQPGLSSSSTNRKPPTSARPSGDYPSRYFPSPGDQPSLPFASPPYNRAYNTPASYTPPSSTASSGSPPPQSGQAQTPLQANSPTPVLQSSVPSSPSTRLSPSASTTPTPLPTSTSGSPPLNGNPPPEAVPLSSPTTLPTPPTTSPTMLPTPPTQLNSPPSTSLPSNSSPPSTFGLASSPTPNTNLPPKISSTPPTQSASPSSAPTLNMLPLSQPSSIQANPPPLPQSPPPSNSPAPSLSPPSLPTNPPPKRSLNLPPIQASPPKASPPQSSVAASSPPPQFKSPPPLLNPPPRSAPSPPRAVLAQSPPPQAIPPPPIMRPPSQSPVPPSPASAGTSPIRPPVNPQPNVPPMPSPLLSLPAPPPPPVKRCRSTADCPVGKGCCTEQGSDKVGYCSSTGFFSNGTQECPNCNAFNGLSCPASKKVCCPSGLCAANNAGCTCQYSGECPYGLCCTEEYSGKIGKCTNAPFDSSGKQVCPNCNYWDVLSSCYNMPILANGTQICPDCKDLNGLKCPTSKPTCCPLLGDCAKSPTDCGCKYAFDCPSGYCCTEEGSGQLGKCTQSPVDPGTGAQICPFCTDLNGAACPASKPVCCSAYGECAAPSVCTNTPVLANGTQVCHDCIYTSCPAGKSMCCPLGDCAANTSGCNCRYASDCPPSFFCTEENSGNIGKCTNSPTMAPPLSPVPSSSPPTPSKNPPPPRNPPPLSGPPPPKIALSQPPPPQASPPSKIINPTPPLNPPPRGAPPPPKAALTQPPPVKANPPPQTKSPPPLLNPPPRSVLPPPKAVLTQPPPVKANPPPSIRRPPPRSPVPPPPVSIKNSPPPPQLNPPPAVLHTPNPPPARQAPPPPPLKRCRSSSDCGVNKGCCTEQNSGKLATECPNCNQFNGLSCPASKKVCCPSGLCAANNAGCTCRFSYECPSGFCCTEEYSGKTGKCTNNPFNSSGNQVCPDCNYWDVLTCPANKPACCALGQCVESAPSCPCSYAGDCPSKYCCSHEYDNTPGVCTNTPVLSNGTQVCPTCGDFNGAACPASKPVCCSSGFGECAASTSACKCKSPTDCPSGFCCTEEYSDNFGVCTNTPVLTNGTQVCPTCYDFHGAACPTSKPVCCPGYGEAASKSACKCQSAGDCPSGYCCTEEDSGNFGVCTNTPVLTNGTQVCPTCKYFNGAACPASKPVCCPGYGECAASKSACKCYWAADCPSGYCCTEEYSDKFGVCTNTPVLTNGTQICPACYDFNGAACPASKPVCCDYGFGDCATSDGACKCVCTSTPVLANGTQVCQDCNYDFNGASCPAGKSMRCPLGDCAANTGDCNCRYASDCPTGFCCTEENSGNIGKCTNKPVNHTGNQVCPNCNDFNGLRCPADRKLCCSGTCKAAC